MMAAEMAVIRLTHVADLPSPDDLVRKLRDTPMPRSDAPAPRPAPAGGSGPVARGVAAQAHAIEFEPAPGAASDLAARIAGRLQGWTGNRWVVSLVSEGGAPTISEVRDSDLRQAEATAMAHPMTQAILQAFPGAELVEIRTRDAMTQDAAQDALAEVEDEWDPFDED